MEQQEKKQWLILAGVLSCGLLFWGSLWHFGAFRQLEPQDQEVYPELVVINEVRGPQPGDPRPKELPVLPFEIDWPASSTIDLGIWNKLSLESKELVKKSAAPVLLPSQPEIPDGASLKIVTSGRGGHYLTVSYSDIPVIINVFAAGEGGGKAPSTPSPYMPDRVRGLPAYIGETEGGWYVSWNEFGAAYYLEIRCFRVPKDPRCTSDQYLRSIVENLHYVGGKGG